MFKIFLQVGDGMTATLPPLPGFEDSAPRPLQITSSHQLPWRTWLLALTLIVPLLGCQTGGARRIPPANLLEPGWTVHRGQAVWRLPKEGREVAGEVLVATRPEGRAFVQFTKEPFPILIGQVTPGRWEVEFPPQNKRVSRPGQPSGRILWLHLPAMLMGRPPPKKWAWRKEGSDWRLENRSTGESLEGYFEP